MKEDDFLFYKYRPITNHTLDSLEKQELYFSYPTEFNDPFDCRYDVYWRGTKEEWHEFLYKYHSKNMLINDSTIKTWIKEGKLKKKGKELLLLPGKNVLTNNINNIYPKICCFTKENNNILMWSHYANQHKGICLCFKTKLNMDAFYLRLKSEDAHLIPVKYKDEMPQKVNLLTNKDPHNTAAFLFTKHTSWGYEKEYRTLIWPSKSNNNKFEIFEKEALNGIIFGIKTAYEDMVKVYNIIDKNYHDNGLKINFYKASMIKGKYEINIKPIYDFDKFLKNYDSKFK